MIQMDILGKQHRFIVDTGSNVNLISSKLVAEHELALTPVGSLSTSGLGGHAEKGDVFMLPYSMDGNQYSDEFSVVSDSTFQVIEEEYGVKISGLVGTSFMLFHRVVIDFSEGVIHLCEKPEDVRLQLRKTQE